MSDEPVLLFLHIPKTAGTTLTGLIYENAADSNRYEEEEGALHSGVYYYKAGFFNTAPLSIPHHICNALRRPSIRAVVGHFHFGLHRLINRPCRYLTMLRDPIDRALSLYHHYNSDEPLEAWLQSTPLLEHDNDQTRRIAGVSPPRGACDRSHLDQALDEMSRFDLAGTTERFDESLILLRRILRWDSDMRYLPRLISRKRQYSEPPSEAGLAMLREMNRFDIDLFDAASRELDGRIRLGGESLQREIDDFKKANESHIAQHADAVAKMGM